MVTGQRRQTFMNSPARETPISDIGIKNFPLHPPHNRHYFFRAKTHRLQHLFLRQTSRRDIEHQLLGLHRVDVILDLLDAFIRRAHTAMIFGPSILKRLRAFSGVQSFSNASRDALLVE